MLPVLHREATNNHSIESGTGESAVGADEILGRLELGLEISLVLCGAIGEGVSVVEALIDRGGGRGSGGDKGKEGRGTHVGDMDVSASRLRCWYSIAACAVQSSVDDKSSRERVSFECIGDTKE